ncbi:MAG: GTP-binding protein, partial [Mariprofundales bacterium]|nr:GTP-binding protein [Mariprofundales bacterium]
MCTTCGCAAGDTTVEGRVAGHGHHNHEEAHEHALQATHAAGVSAARILRIEQDILSINSRYAADNRSYFIKHGILVLNMVSSPGSGKTTLLTRTLQEMQSEFVQSVIEGDQQTLLDAERIRA